MLIDAHNHPNWHGHDAKKMLENMDKHGIDKTWLLSWEAPEDEYSPSYHAVLPPGGVGIPLEDVLQVAKEAPDRFEMGYIPHPKRPDAIDRLKAAHEIHGVKLAGELKVRVLFDDPDAIQLYHVAGELGMPITIHLDYPLKWGPNRYPRPNYWYGGSLDAFERAVAACPDTIFIGHAPGFWAHISADDKYDKESYPKGPVVPGGRIFELMRKYDNLHADLSAGSALTALKRDPEVAKGFMIEFQDKVLWARDYFDWVLMEFFETLDLPKDVYDKITYKNALKMLGEEE
jgi:predicted TIM-barrel fold metal-dependent hydrolase